MSDGAQHDETATPDEVPFGFRKVARDEKSGLVRGVFD